jgi:site-specific recombinase XerD
MTGAEAGLAVAAAAERYVGALRSRQAPPNTVKAYAHDLRRFAAAAPGPLAAVTPAAVTAFLDADGPRGPLSPATRRRRRATLAAFFRWLARQGLIAVSPVDRVDPVETAARLPRPLEESAVDAVLRAIPPGATRDRALFTLLYETGMRVGEALGLQVADVDLTPDDERVRVLGKGRRERTVLLAAAPESIRLLRRHLKASGLRTGSVFRGDPRYGGSARPADYTTVRRAWRRYCAAAGAAAPLPTIHQLRHSRASQLVRAGVPLGTVRRLLGHRNIQSTMLYADVDQATVRRDLLAYQSQTARRRGRAW